jgi:hypothetical protein
MTRRQPQAEQLKAVSDPLENQKRTLRKSERETFAVYKLPNEGDDANTEREFLLTLPVDQDVERRIKRDYGAGSYRVEHRRGGRFVSVTEMHFDEPPQREEVFARESDAPEDFDERVAQAVEDILEARRAERARARTLRPNPAPGLSLQQPAAATDPLNDLVRTVSVLKQLGVPIGEVSRAAAEAPKDKDEDDRVLLSLLKDRSLRQRITASIASMVGDPDASEPQAWYVHMMQALETQPQLTSKLFGLIDRVMPSIKADDDAGDDEDGEIDLEESCVNYLLEKCAANESITLNDEPVRALAVASPQGFNDFLGLINLASVEQIIEHLSKDSDLARVVLRAPHAHAWFVRLKELAAAVT